MKIKRLGIVALVYILVVGIFGITAEAESFSERDPVYLEELPCDTLDGATVKLIGSNAAQRAMQTLNVTVSANMVGVADESFPADTYAYPPGAVSASTANIFEIEEFVVHPVVKRNGTNVYIENAKFVMHPKSFAPATIRETI